MIYAHAAVALLAAVVAATGAWKVQEWRHDAKEKDHAEQHLADERSAATAAIRRTEAVITATNTATVRSAALRRDADSARSAVVSLHDAAAQALRDAATSHAACTERASALGDVLQQSAERYRGLGETCDRHVSDIRALIEGWPE